MPYVKSMEAEEVDPTSKCCVNCMWFDQRCGFCRLNPPQVVMSYANRLAFPTAVFPKVSMPALDWCSYFKYLKKNETIEAGNR